MGVDEEVANASFAQELLGPAHIAALGEPHAGRPLAKVGLVVVGRDLHLGAHGRPVAVREGKEQMRGRARDELELPGPLHLGEATQDVAFVAAEGLAYGAQPVAIHLGEAAEVGLVLGPLDFAMRQVDGAVEKHRVALHEHGVAQHRGKRR